MDIVKAKIRGARVLWRQHTLSVLGAFEGKQLRTVAVVEQGLIQRAPSLGNRHSATSAGSKSGFSTERPRIHLGCLTVLRQWFTQLTYIFVSTRATFVYAVG